MNKKKQKTFLTLGYGRCRRHRLRPSTTRVFAPLFSKSGHFLSLGLCEGRPIDGLHYFYSYGNMEKAAAVAALAALAQETRLDIFRLLVQAGPEGLAAGQIGERLALPSATLSFHLNQLKHAGLITFRRAGRSLIYGAAYTAMTDLLAYLTENCCQGDAARCGVKVSEATPLMRTEHNV
ncbi:MAG TPA: metalloregulator ArsR/SmtB family transcription factor [Acidocella sp.]|nr:metalloregulator ArsR/SmtB family transcription factor [Acidocella sp.]